MFLCYFFSYCNCSLLIYVIIKTQYMQLNLTALNISIQRVLSIDDSSQKNFVYTLSVTENM